MENVRDVVERLAGAAGSFDDDDGSYRFADLADRVHRLAGGLAAAGVERGATIGVWLPNQREWVECALGAGLLGARVAVLNPRYQRGEVEHATHATGMSHLVYRETFSGTDFGSRVGGSSVLRALGRIVIGPRERDEGQIAYADLLDAEAVDGEAWSDEPWITFFTSGTTSQPKAVVHSQRGLVRHAVFSAERQGLTADGAVLLTLPFCGVMGFVSLMEALAVGHDAHTMARFDAERAATLFAEQPTAVWNCIDEMLQRVLERPAARDGQLATGALANFGADPQELLDAAREVLGATFVQPYGMSEVQALATLPAVDAPPDRLHRPGGPIVTPGTEYRVCDPTSGEPLSDGDVGELQMRGATLALGYLEDGGKLRQMTDDDGWFATGDLARVAPDGIDFISRFKDALRLRGFLVSPSEIENVLVEHPQVEAAQVVGAGDPVRVVAFVLGAAELDEGEVIAWLAERIADFKVPARVVQVTSFPVTEGPHGAKVQRGVLREDAERLLAER